MLVHGGAEVAAKQRSFSVPAVDQRVEGVPIEVAVRVFGRRGLGFGSPRVAQHPPREGIGADVQRQDLPPRAKLEGPGYPPLPSERAVGPAIGQHAHSKQIGLLQHPLGAYGGAYSAVQLGLYQSGGADQRGFAYPGSAQRSDGAGESGAVRVPADLMAALLQRA